MIQYDPTAAVYELFSQDGEWLGAYDTYAEAKGAQPERAPMFDKHDRVQVQSFNDATVVQDQDGDSDQVLVAIDGGCTVWIAAAWLTLIEQPVRVVRAVSVGAAMLFAAACTTQPPQQSYAAIVVLRSGAEYRVASGLTGPECGKRMADMPAGDWYCEAEGR